MTPEVYISYAWRDREKDPTPDDRESIVDELCAALEGRSYPVRRDKTQVGYKESIGDFMREIGAANRVIVVVSDKYLRSKYCMYEAIEVLNRRDLDGRLFPIVLNDALIHDSISALEYVAFWEREVTKLENALNSVSNQAAKFRYQEELRDLKNIAEKIQDFMTWIADKNTLSAGVHLSNCFEQLCERLISLDKSANDAVEYSKEEASGTPPVFARIDQRYCNFQHALRPAQTKLVVSKLPSAINTIGPSGWGFHRFLDDVKNSGITALVHIVQVKLSHYLTNYPLLVQDIIQQTGIKQPPANASLRDIFAQCAIRHNKPVLFILERADAIFEAEPETLHAQYNLGFLYQMRSLIESDFMSVLMTAKETINRRSFQGDASPLWLEDISLNALSYEDIQREVSRRLPNLPAELMGFIASQLEYEPRETYDLLDRLLVSLQGRNTITKEIIGADLTRFRSGH